uniref:Uncharacterized protein n=1 Tax=viral metagenome TaxID=1070528 RepID=A0A6C0LMG9_9ZZZZ
MPSPRCAPFITAAGVFNSQLALNKLTTAQRGECDLEARLALQAKKHSPYAQAQGGRRTRKNRKNRKGRKGGKSRRNRH